jgi:CMP-N,N'-diacetyllegionaminic acid synthase
MKILHLILARGGSKGIPDKNIQEIEGLPLVAFKAISARRARYCHRLIISTDSPVIQDVARCYDVEVPFTRPAKLATDTASSMDAIAHAIDFIESENSIGVCDAIMLHEPTSPFTTHKHLDGAVDLMMEKGADVVVGVKPVDIHSSKHGVIDEDLRIHRPIDKLGYRYHRRQDDEQEYVLNGSIYLFKWEYFKEHGKILAQPDNIHAFIMDPLYSIEVDHPRDLAWCKFLLQDDCIDRSYWFRTVG